MAQTLQDKYTAKLLELGAKRVETRSSKYRVFEYTFKANNKAGVEGEFTRFVFLGKAGAVRWGVSKTADASLSNPPLLLRHLNAIQARAEGFQQEAA